MKAYLIRVYGLCLILSIIVNLSIATMQFKYVLKIEDIGFATFVAPFVSALIFGIIIAKIIFISSELKRKAITDYLTGIYNRHFLAEQLKKTIAVSRRHGTPLCLVMIDVDDFKEINDTCGHKVGDIVLQNIASLLKNSIRESDTCARWGGEEFILVLLNTEINEGEKKAVAIKEKISQTRVCQKRKVTCSFGVTAFHRDDESYEVTVHRADTALYSAKAKGKNRVEVIVPGE